MAGIWDSLTSPQKLGVGAALGGGIGNVLGGIFGGDSDPSGAAMKYLEQIKPMLKEYLDPYIKHGEEAYDVFSPIAKQMTADPAKYLSGLTSQYEQSPEFDMQLQDALRAASNTAAAGGMTGTMQDIQNQGNIGARVRRDDMQRWLQNVLGVQQRGMGAEQNLYGTGFGASSTLADTLANVLGQQAQYQFQGEREKAQQGQDLLGGLGGIAGMLFNL